MMKRSSAILIALTAMTLLSGCAGAVKYPNYYALTVPAPPDPPAPETAHAILAVREFRAPEYLRRGAIVYRPSPEQIGFYNYHRWATDPRDFVTEAVMDRLRASGKFAQVESYKGRADIDYVLTGRLENLEEVDYGGDVKVEVSLSAQLERLSTGATVWTNSVTEEGQVAHRDVPAVVAAMNRTMEEAMDKLLTPAPAVPGDPPSAAQRGAP